MAFNSTISFLMSPARKSLLIYILSALLGCFFIFSAYTKTQPVESFEYTLRAQIGFPSFTAAYWARFFIGLESALGFLLLINVFGRQLWAVKASFWLIVAFSVHLVYLLMTVGNDVSCGCMGDLIPMLPVPSLLKNIGLLVLLGVLWKHAPRNNGARQQWLAIVLMCLLVITPYVLFPYQNKFLKVEKLYSNGKKYIPTEDLRTGKHFVAFLSLTCSHCMHAGEKLTVMKRSNPSLPIYVVFGDIDNDTLKNEMLINFKKEAKFADVPFSFIDQKDFVELAKGSVPAMYWIDNTEIVREVDLGALNQRELELWLQKN